MAPDPGSGPGFWLSLKFLVLAPISGYRFQFLDQPLFPRFGSSFQFRLQILIWFQVLVLAPVSSFRSSFWLQASDSD